METSRPQIKDRLLSVWTRSSWVLTVRVGRRRQPPGFEESVSAAGDQQGGPSGRRVKGHCRNLGLVGRRDGGVQDEAGAKRETSEVLEVLDRLGDEDLGTSGSAHRTPTASD